MLHLRQARRRYEVNVSLVVLEDLPMANRYDETYIFPCFRAWQHVALPRSLHCRSCAPTPVLVSGWTLHGRFDLQTSPWAQGSACSRGHQQGEKGGVAQLVLEGADPNMPEGRRAEPFMVAFQDILKNLK
mmetsp:Transcript_6122/g.13189  ORF Transcript_6122/g.13189 Transcript_6122/m.13189 type:complete len:130 (-) Transcript_6122:16-405(-)